MTKITEIQNLSLWEKKFDRPVPFSFDLEITARCNMNCRHCYINLPAGDLKSRKNELTSEKILEIARQTADFGAMWCLITGGEPLLRDDFVDIYLGLKRLGLLVSVFTNGTLIRQEHIDLFRHYPPRDLEITVYGVSEKVYEAVTRVKGSFKKFCKGLDLLDKFKIPIRLKAMAIQTNFNEQQAIAEFCRKRTKDFFRFDPQLHLRFDGNPERNAEIRSERLAPSQIMALENLDPQRMQAMRKHCDNLIKDKKNESDNEFIFQCGTGINSFAISYDGLFRLCSSLWAEGTTYDLKSGSLTEAWQDFVPKVRRMKFGNPHADTLGTCHRCIYCNICFWCPAHAHLETGSLDGKTPYFCEVAHMRAENIQNRT
jgi:radical SAM protein with 4Fe4S-binding SPASM domain